MSAHTPGPWTIANYPHAVVVQTESHKKTAYGASRYAAIGGFDRSDPEQMAEALANARLIAAAPELLEACQAMIEWDAREQDHAVDFNARMALCRIAFDKARAAIAKATGEQA